MSARLPKVVPFKEGQEEAGRQALLDAVKVAQGPLGWGGMARLFVEMGFDREFVRFYTHGRRLPNKRIRRKIMKRALKQVFLANAAKHWDVAKAVW